MLNAPLAPVSWITPLAVSTEGELAVSSMTALRPEVGSTTKIWLALLVLSVEKLEALLPNATNRPPALMVPPRSDAASP